MGSENIKINHTKNGQWILRECWLLLFIWKIMMHFGCIKNLWGFFCKETVHCLSLSVHFPKLFKYRTPPITPNVIPRSTIQKTVILWNYLVYIGKLRAINFNWLLKITQFFGNSERSTHLSSSCLQSLLVFFVSFCF